MNEFKRTTRNILKMCTNTQVAVGKHQVDVTDIGQIICRQTDLVGFFFSEKEYSCRRIVLFDMNARKLLASLLVDTGYICIHSPESKAHLDAEGLDI